MSMELTAVEKPKVGFSKWAHKLFSFYLRLLAAVFFAASVYAWLRVIGYWEGETNRFDTMPVLLKIFSAIMVVVLPVASVGLWTTLSWGRVMWILAVSLQTIAVLQLNHTIGLPFEVVFFHAGSIGIYLGFQIVLYIIDKKV